MNSGCSHETTEVRRQIDRLSRPRLARQCLSCGLRVGEWLPSKTLPPAGKPSFGDWDNGLEEAGKKRIEAEWVERRRQSQNEWLQLSEDHRQRYWEYLKTPEWRSKRERVIARDKMCRACELRPPREVHHLTYVRIFNEPLFDLVGVCETCHRALHPEKQSASSNAA